MLGALLNEHPGAVVLHEFGLPKLLESLAAISRLVHVGVAYQGSGQEQGGATDATARNAEDLDRDSLVPSDEAMIALNGSGESYEADDLEATTLRLDSPSQKRLVSTERFYRWRGDRARHDAYTFHHRINKGIFDQVTQAYFQVLAPGKRALLVGDKMPGVDAALIREVRSIVPNLKVLMIVRSPIDCVNSSMRRKELAERQLDDWSVQTAEDALRNWIADWNTASEVRAEIGEDLHFVEYDALCADPGRALAEVHKFLGLDLAPATWRPSSLPDKLKGAFVSDKDENMVRQYVGPLLDHWRYLPAAELVERFSPIFAPIKIGTRVSLAAGGGGTHYIHGGFSTGEPHGTWTDGRVANIGFRIPSVASALVLELWVCSAIFDKQGCAILEVFVGQDYSCIQNVDSVPHKVSILLPERVLQQDQNVRLRMVLHTAKEPNVGADPRALGVCLEALRISRLTDIIKPVVP